MSDLIKDRKRLAELKAIKFDLEENVPPEGERSEIVLEIFFLQHPDLVDLAIKAWEKVEKKDAEKLANLPQDIIEESYEELRDRNNFDDGEDWNYR